MRGGMTTRWRVTPTGNLTVHAWWKDHPGHPDNLTVDGGMTTRVTPIHYPRDSARMVE